MSDERDRLLAELAYLDPALARRLQHKPGVGRPTDKDSAVLAGVWVAVMRERFQRSVGKGRRGPIPSIKHACELLADRGYSHRNGGGGIRFQRNDGRDDIVITDPETIRRWYSDAWDAAREGDELVRSRMEHWFRCMISKRAQVRREARFGDEPVAWERTADILRELRILRP